MLKRVFNRLFGARESIPEHAEDASADAARQEVVRRTFETGRVHVANVRRDGSWEIRVVDDD